MEPRGETETPRPSAQGTNPLSMETNSAVMTSDSSPSGNISPPPGKDTNSVPHPVEKTTAFTQNKRANRTDALVAALGNADAATSGQKGESGSADGALAAVASVAAPSKPPLSTKGSKKKSEVKSPPEAVAPVVDDAGYSSAIVVDSRDTGKLRQLRPSSSPRSSHIGRQVIADACKLAEPFSGRLGGDNSTVFAAGGLSVNGQYQTIPEEYAEYRKRNQVSLNYHGPVYVVEDVWVPCNACGAPVDPVRRVPVGSLFFHENCVRCYLCERRTGVAGLYLQVDRRAVCSDCAGRGYEQWVPRQEARSRGLVYGSIRGGARATLDAHDRDTELQRQRRHRQSEQQRFIVGLLGNAGRASSALNKATVPGALPPSLAISSVHNCRNTSARSFALMERQQYYTQSDNNLIMALPTSAVRSPFASGLRQSSTAKVPYGITNGRNV
ncbi:hypothetical protein JIQ42_02072 [Leishmania sp. Namibia]|uniref:hypothetical protein n=1 Tax=Leishmania sp. Namibia TaxID=2802991 RepID=UPI001B766E74|nr:hypothetical protein JIQ42_02072 [Leishmania sp. Namibia]